MAFRHAILLMENLSLVLLQNEICSRPQLAQTVKENKKQEHQKIYILTYCKTVLRCCTVAYRGNGFSFEIVYMHVR